MHVKFNKNQIIRGFTLVELLIAISIIAILSVAFIPRLIGGQEKARDARRQRDLNVIYQGIQSWGADNGVYPGYLYDSGIPSYICISEDSGAINEIGQYLSVMPTGPKKDINWQGPDATCNSGGYEYLAVQGGKGFLLIAEMENTLSSSKNFYESITFQPNLEDDLQTILSEETSCAEGDCEANGSIFILYR